MLILTMLILTDYLGSLRIFFFLASTLFQFVNFQTEYRILFSTKIPAPTKLPPTKFPWNRLSFSPSCDLPLFLNVFPSISQHFPKNYSDCPPFTPFTQNILEHPPPKEVFLIFIDPCLNLVVIAPSSLLLRVPIARVGFLKWRGQEKSWAWEGEDGEFY